MSSEAEPTSDEREELAASIRDDPFLKLVDFTRDVYRTMIVSATSEAAEAELTERAVDLGYEVRDGPDGQGLILEAPEGASEKVSMGGNRLMYPPSDRSRTSPETPKKSASRQADNDTGEGTDEGGWDPQPVSLREGETPDETSHASRNLETLRDGLRGLLPDVGERVTTPHQDLIVSSETDVDGEPAVLLTTPNSDRELYRLRFDQGPGEDPVLEYHRPDKSRRPVGGSHPRKWHPKSRQVSCPGNEVSGGDE